MRVYENLISKKENLAVIGLGYVGMPLAVAFAKKVKVIGFDLNTAKIELYKKGIDPTGEIGDEEIKNTEVYFTSKEEELKKAQVFIVAVPTPINSDKTPDLKPIENASEIIAKYIKKDSVVIFESTVYPGVTENVCIPILEQVSGMKCGEDFKVGYSPERINPGDKIHRLENIVKIVSGIDQDSLNEIAKIYELIIDAEIFKASSIKVAEAAKVAENSQRDINIAFMNELAMVFDIMKIDTNEVIKAMNTKWNALGFKPGLVGGHCIGVDPYYFIYQAEKLGYHSQIILSGRKINDGMGKFIADATIKELIKADKLIKKSKIVFFGITFKEDCPDIRNSKVIDIIRALEEYGVEIEVCDPYAEANEVEKYYGLKLTDINDISDADCLIFSVSHSMFKEFDMNYLSNMYKKTSNTEKILIDVKGIFDVQKLKENGFSFWRL